MKKIIDTGLAVGIVISLVACGSPSSDSKVAESVVTEQDSNISVEVESEESTDEVVESEPERELVKAVTVFSDDKVDIEFTEVEKNGVHFNVINKTDATVTIQADSIAINGISTNDIVMSDDVLPQSSGEVVASCHLYPEDRVEYISGQLRIIDFDNSFKTYNALFTNIPVVDAPRDVNEYIRQCVEELPLIYSDDNLDLYFLKADNIGMHFMTVNHTETNITVQADSVSVDGISVNDITMSDDVAPLSVGEVVAKCHIATTEPRSISGQLRIIDFENSFKTYSVILNNVSLSEETGEAIADSLVEGKTLLYEDEIARIYYESVDNQGVHFIVENITDMNITIQADAISVNGISENDITMSDDVAPKSTGEVVAKCKVDYSQKVNTIGGQLRIIDFGNSFETKKASFINIPVE